MTGAFLTVSAGAQAQIVYTDVNPDVVIAGAYLVDMDNDATPDVGLYQGVGGTATVAIAYPVPSHASNALMGVVGGGGYRYPSLLAAGAPISSAGNWVVFASNTAWTVESFCWNYFTGNQLGVWSAQAGYTGVRFLSAGNTYYGWIDMEVATNGTAITIKGYAYESTPDGAINAGDVGGVGINSVQVANSEIGNFFPNPMVNGKTKIQFASKENAEVTIEVMNGMGQQVAVEKRNVINGKNTLSFDFSALSAGTYFAKFSTGKAVTFRKIVIAG
jgi:hypothetical protein